MGFEGGDSRGGLFERRRFKGSSKIFEEGRGGVEAETGGNGCESSRGRGERRREAGERSFREESKLSSSLR